jgi:hypothetical protein
MAEKALDAGNKMINRGQIYPYSNTDSIKQAEKGRKALDEILPGKSPF